MIHPTYETILFDLDHTIFDFDASEELAFAEALAVVGITEAASHLATYRRLNNALWAAAERGEIRSNSIRNVRFRMLADELHLDGDDVTVLAIADAFIAGLAAHGELFPGAREVLVELHHTATLAVVSNGLGEVVQPRIDRLGIRELFGAVVVSSEVGVAKPDPAIFDAVFDQLGQPDKTTALMVGDSLSSDIAGGTAYGIDTCWYNPHHRVPSAADRFTYEIGALEEILKPGLSIPS